MYCFKSIYKFTALLSVHCPEIPAVRGPRRTWCPFCTCPVTEAGFKVDPHTGLLTHSRLLRCSDNHKTEVFLESGIEWSMFSCGLVGIRLQIALRDLEHLLLLHLPSKCWDYSLYYCSKQDFLLKLCYDQLIIVVVYIKNICDHFHYLTNIILMF